MTATARFSDDVAEELPPLIRHLESFLGPIDAGFRVEEADRPPGVQIVRFRNAPSAGATTFSTLGLSSHWLHQRKGRPVRMELLFACRAIQEPVNIAALMLQVAGEALATHRAFSRGDCIGPRGRLFSAHTLEALYVGNPVYFPDELVSLNLDSTPVIFAWLIPVSLAEARLCREDGWRVLEQRIADVDPDLLDLDRPSSA